MLQPATIGDKPIIQQADLSELLLHGTAVGWSLDPGSSGTRTQTSDTPCGSDNDTSGLIPSGCPKGNNSNLEGPSNQSSRLPSWDSFSPILLKVFEIQTVTRVSNAAEDGVPQAHRSSSNPSQRESDTISSTAAVTSVRAIHLYQWINDPTIVEYRDFLSAQECVTAISLANQFGWAPSKTSIGKAYSTQESYSSAESGNRTSFTAAVYRMQHPFFATVENRMARLLGVPVEKLESLTVLRYHPGQQFKVHHDGDFRHQTVLIYLNDVEEGGGTAFPALGLVIMPKRGMALSWQNSKMDGSAHMGTLHAGLPVTRGEKYCIPIFVNRNYVR